MKIHSLFVYIVFLYLPANAQTIINMVEGYENCIWTVDNLDDIATWQVTADNLTFIEIYADQAPNNLAIGHIKISSDTLLNTFIAAEASSKKIYYWNGIDWIEIPIELPHFPFGMGAHKENIYIYDEEGIRYFDGVSNTVCINNINPSIADIAVDSLGHVWAVTSSDSMKSDSIIVMDQEGEIKHQFPFGFTLTIQNGFGLTILNDTIYMGFGSQNTYFPRKIIRVVIRNEVAEFVDEIIDYNNTFYTFSDIASSTPGLPYGTKNDTTSTNNLLTNKTEPISFYPNPTNNFNLI